MMLVPNGLAFEYSFLQSASVSVLSLTGNEKEGSNQGLGDSLVAGGGAASAGAGAGAGGCGLAGASGVPFS